MAATSAPPCVPSPITRSFDRIYIPNYTFTSLPGEIRNHIYEIVFAGRCLSTVARKPRSKTPKDLIPPLAIFIVNKQISLEARSVFFSKSVFVMGTPNCEEAGIPELNRFLRTVPAPHIAMIQRLELRFNFISQLWQHKSEHYWPLAVPNRNPPLPAFGVRLNRGPPWPRAAPLDSDDKDILECIHMCKMTVKHFTGLNQVCFQLSHLMSFHTAVDTSDNSQCFKKIMKILARCENLEDIWIRHRANEKMLPVFDGILKTKEYNGTVARRATARKFLAASGPTATYYVDWWKRPGVSGDYDDRFLRGILENQVEWKGLDIGLRQLNWEIV